MNPQTRDRLARQQGAVHCGFPYQGIPYDPYVVFGMSKRSIRVEEKRHA